MKKKSRGEPILVCICRKNWPLLVREQGRHESLAWGQPFVWGKKGEEIEREWVKDRRLLRGRCGNCERFFCLELAITEEEAPQSGTPNDDLVWRPLYDFLVDHPDKVRIMHTEQGQRPHVRVLNVSPSYPLQLKPFVPDPEMDEFVRNLRPCGDAEIDLFSDE